MSRQEMYKLGTYNMNNDIVMTYNFQTALIYKALETCRFKFRSGGGWFVPSSEVLERETGINRSGQMAAIRILIAQGALDMQMCKDQDGDKHMLIKLTGETPRNI